ncbi:phage antirepressor KilAC domain-containing protein [Treponema putidum]|uniref:phage antirepressor KilAC domain-containing protein n=1 Tax=Treponema putidum TaxID=221027 RepID=UPI003D8F8028
MNRIRKSTRDKEDYSTKQLADFLKTTPKVVLENARKCLPNKEVKKGIATYWSKEEVTIILEQMKMSNPNQHTFTAAVKDVSTDLTPTYKKLKALELYSEAVQEEIALLKSKNQELSIQLLEASLKVEYFDRFIGSDNCFNFTTVSSQFGILPVERFTKLLRDYGFIRYSNKCLIPTEKYAGKGYFKIRDWQKQGDSGIQTLITPFGKSELYSFLKEKNEL